MADYVLDKGFKWEGTAAVASFLCAKLGAGGAWTADLSSVAASKVVGVLQEPLDATKAATGKAVVNLRIMGVTRCVSGAAAAGVIAVGDYVTVDTAGKVQATTTAGNQVVGRALTATTAADQQLDVHLTLGMIYAIT